LPIFRELESAWFRTRRAAAEESAAAGQAPPADARLGTTTAGGKGAGTAATRAPAAPPNKATSTGQPAAGGLPRAPEQVATSGPAVPANPAALPRRTPDVATSAWQTAADDGWRAATAAAETPVNETTRAGLPKRTPMAQLVPGGVDKGPSAVQRRTPEAVRGLLSAYHRGVQRGRTQPKDDQTDPQPTPAGQQSAQAGKEHES
ncbi:MAG TPA: ATPase, partial [Pilimelia sp.]|nr:ATPase [Pilimelia sp.]